MYHDAKRLGHPSPVPKPQDLADCKEVGDTAWMAWLDTRPEGTVLAESARSYRNRSTTILENLDRARKIELDRRKRVRAPGSPDIAAWTKGPEMDDVLKALSMPLTKRPGSGKKNKFYSVIECANADFRITPSSKTKENSHYYHPCSDSSSVRWSIKNGYAQQLFFSMRLLWTGRWGMGLHKMMLANEDEWYIEVCQLSEASEDQLISALQHKSHGARDDQWMKEQNTVVKLTLAQMDKEVDLGIKSGDFLYKKFATALDARRNLK
ncbi:hypothetical protein QFC22_002424 [Naganishia vaughanmartiniae]|uniref:Uncharacterized protein n=1 Tax=Naganishia vaughanmartiniae TaxID=1424756 RepID=A0ACC2XEJ0_9TREE|nr:hypothetical protein QFC22_002424 [Naganishia vaughanmartiniae]